MHQSSSSERNSGSAFLLGIPLEIPDPATASNIQPFVTCVAFRMSVTYPPDSRSSLRPLHRRNSQKEGSR